MDSPSTSRKFVDLIYKASAKWANWNPPHEIKVGDFGTLDKETADFKKAGNIYDDTHIYKDESIANLVREHPPKPAAREDVYIASSTKVKRSDLKSGAELVIAGLADASIKGQWSFGSKRGALLVMACPRSFYIPRDTILTHLAKVDALKEMSLVTETFSCPAYCLYLSDGSDEVVDLAFLGSLPFHHAPSVTAGGEITGRWWVQNTTGLFRSGRDQHGKDEFTPLYMLKEIRRSKGFFSRRGEKILPKFEGDDLWANVQTPWDPLDEDGNEEEFEDTIFD